MLHAGAPVLAEVLLDLDLASSFPLVDRELEPAAAVGHHLRHERGVLGRDRLVGEVDQLGHAEDALVVARPTPPCGRAPRCRPRGRCRRRAGRRGPRRVPRSRAGRRPRSRRAPRTGGPCRRRWPPPRAATSPVLVPDPCAGSAPRARRARPRGGRRPPASGTLSAILWTPSPWRLWCSPISSSPESAPGQDEPDAALLEHVRHAVAAAGLEPASTRSR